MKHTAFSLRFLVLTLAALLLLGTFCACGDTATPEGTSAPAASETEAPKPVEEETTEPAPTYNFDLTLLALVWSDNSAPEFGITESTGDMVKDSVYTRNLHVEDALGIKLTEEAIPGNNGNREAFLKHAQTAAAGGTNYDLYGGYSMATALIATNGLARNMLNYPVINFSNPWWSEGLIKEGTIRGKLYFATGDMSTSLLYQMYCVFFNKDLVEEYNLESPYSCIQNNTWTYEKMFGMAAAVQDDTADLESKMYGMTFESTVYVDPFFFAADLRTTESDAEGNLVLSESFYGDKVEEVASKVWDYLHQPNITTADSKSPIFSSGRALLQVATVNFASLRWANTAVNYGVMPIPKYSADQEKFKSCVGFAHTLYAIPSTAEHPEASATAIEYMGRYGYQDITPALFEITMKARYAKDPDSTRSFDIIRESASFDVGRIFTSSLDNMTYNIFRSNITAAAKSSYLTAFAAKQKSLKKRLSDLNSAFAALSDAG